MDAWTHDFGLDHGALGSGEAEYESLDETTRNETSTLSTLAVFD
jgi:hypothetical protein